MQTTRHTCRTAAQPSRASPAPTKSGMVWLPSTCGSWLASDADNSAYLPDRGAAIAGKPDSHKGWSGVAPRYLWELACQRCRQLDMPAGPRCSHRGQAQLLQRVEWCGSPVPVGAGLPAMQTTRHACQTAVQPSRASPAPTKGGVAWLPGICGSWFASDADNSAYPAGPRCSHRGQARLSQRVEWCGSSVLVGAGLPAMQTTRHACRTAVLPSRASPAPTKGGVVRLPGTCGSWLASDGGEAIANKFGLNPGVCDVLAIPAAGSKQ